MDSPFLTNKPLDDDDGTLVLADLSIADEDSFDVPPRGFGRGAPPASASASSSIASSSSRPVPVAPPSTSRPPSKPRFSLFAPGMAETPAHASTLRSGARPLDPPSERSDRSQQSQPPERPPRSDRRPPTFAWDETVQEEAEEAEPEPEPEDDRPGETQPEPRAEPQSAEARDEALRNSLAELRRINTVFDTMMGALEEGRAHNTVRPRLVSCAAGNAS